MLFTAFFRINHFVVSEGITSGVPENKSLQKQGEMEGFKDIMYRVRLFYSQEGMTVWTLSIACDDNET